MLPLCLSLCVAVFSLSGDTVLTFLCSSWKTLVSFLLDGWIPCLPFWIWGSFCSFMFNLSSDLKWILTINFGPYCSICRGEMNRLSNYHAHLTPPTAPKKGILVTAPGAYGGCNGPQSLPWGGVSSTGKPPTLSSGADQPFCRIRIWTLYDRVWNQNR
jgi:hypothetical protein